MYDRYFVPGKYIPVEPQPVVKDCPGSKRPDPSDKPSVGLSGLWDKLTSLLKPGKAASDDLLLIVLLLLLSRESDDLELMITLALLLLPSPDRPGEDQSHPEA